MSTYQHSVRYYLTVWSGICFGPLTTRGPSERCHQIFDSLLDFALTKQSVVRMLMSSSVSPSSHSSTSVVQVIGDLSKNISKVAYKLVLLTKCEEKTVPTTQLTQGYQSCCQPSVQLSTLRTSYPSPLASNLCAAIFLWNYLQCISEVQFALAIQTFSEELGRQTGITLSESKRMDGSTWMGAKFFLPDCHVILFTW